MNGSICKEIIRNDNYVSNLDLKIYIKSSFVIIFKCFKVDKFVNVSKIMSFLYDDMLIKVKYYFLSIYKMMNKVI